MSVDDEKKSEAEKAAADDASATPANDDAAADRAFAKGAPKDKKDAPAPEPEPRPEPAPQPTPTPASGAEPVGVSPSFVVFSVGAVFVLAVLIVTFFDRPDAPRQPATLSAESERILGETATAEEDAAAPAETATLETPDEPAAPETTAAKASNDVADASAAAKDAAQTAVASNDPEADAEADAETPEADASAAETPDAARVENNVADAAKAASAAQAEQQAPAPVESAPVESAASDSAASDPEADGARAIADADAVNDEIANLRAEFERQATAFAASLGDGGDAAAQGENAAALERTAQRIAALERSIQTGAEGAGGLSDRAAAALAIANLDRAAAAGRPFADELAALRDMGFDAPTSAALTGAAALGLAPLDDLRLRFEPTVRAALAAAARENAGGPLGELAASVSEIAGSRPTNPVEGDAPAAVISRAEAKLANGDLAGSIVELSALSGAPAAAFTPWRKDATARRDALAAIAQLNAALVERGR
ncbi:MAG: COG4223 family protein [Parvularculaceae bacterium]